MNCSVIGIGKLGLCFALALEKAGCNVIGVDNNIEYVKKLNSGVFMSDEPGLVDALRKATKFKATDNLEYAVTNSKFIFILVQTPQTTHSYDHTILEKVINDIKLLNADPKHIIVNSTVLPGFNAMHNVEPHTLSYNPAFVAQGTIMDDYANGGKFNTIVAGTNNEEVKEALTTIYTLMNANVNIKFMSPASCEVFKIADNTFRVIKIVYANLISDLVKKTSGAVVSEVADALKADISIGNICMTPGYGYGGPCYPRDLVALTNYATDLGICADILKGANMCNEDHHNTLLGEFLQQNLDEYVFDDISYRQGMKVRLLDNSPVLRIVQDLIKNGKNVKY
jgi:nucleotide sugar dehydrogenase